MNNENIKIIIILKKNDYYLFCLIYFCIIDRTEEILIVNHLR